MKETGKSGPGMVQSGSVQFVIGDPFRVPNRPRKMLVENIIYLDSNTLQSPCSALFV